MLPILFSQNAYELLPSRADAVPQLGPPRSAGCGRPGFTPSDPPGHLPDNATRYSPANKRVSRLSAGTSDASQTQSMLIYWVFLPLQRFCFPPSACMASFLTWSVSGRVRLVCEWLWARAGDVPQLIIGHGAKLGLAGIAIGFPSALVLAKLLSQFLFGVSPADSVTIISVVALMSMAGLAGVLHPCTRRRAYRSYDCVEIRIVRRTNDREPVFPSICQP